MDISLNKMIVTVSPQLFLIPMESLKETLVEKLDVCICNSEYCSLITGSFEYRLHNVYFLKGVHHVKEFFYSSPSWLKNFINIYNVKKNELSFIAKNSKNRTVVDLYNKIIPDIFSFLPTNIYKYLHLCSLVLDRKVFNYEICVVSENITVTVTFVADTDMLKRVKNELVDNI